MTPMQAKDLSREVPRSPLDEIDGYRWLPRLIDKARALFAGTIGDYTPYPCGADQRFLKTFGLDKDALGDLIKRGASDAEVAAWVRSQAGPDIVQVQEAFRQGQLAPLAGEMAEYLKGAVAESSKEHPGLDYSKVDNFTRLICLEEGHPCPGL